MTSSFPSALLKRPFLRSQWCLLILVPSGPWFGLSLGPYHFYKLGLLFYTEDGGCRLIRNVSNGVTSHKIVAKPERRWGGVQQFPLLPCTKTSAITGCLPNEFKDNFNDPMQRPGCTSDTDYKYPDGLRLCSRLLSWSFSLRISTVTPTIMNEIFVIKLSSPRVNTRIVPSLGHECLTNRFQFIIQ
jgi:hypothetical protein